MNRLVALQEELNKHRSAAKSPTPLQHRRTKTVSSLHRLKANHAYSVAKTFNNIDQAIRDAHITVPLHHRMKPIVQNPWMLNQNNEGNCGFAAAIMAKLHLAGQNLQPQQAENQKRAALIDLLNAIYFDQQIQNAQPYTREATYLDLTARSKTLRGNQPPGLVLHRIEKRLAHYPDIGDVSTCLLDYVLIVGLAILYRSHLKQGDNNERLLYQELEDFQTLFGFTKPGKLKDNLGTQNPETIAPSGAKKGDYALTSQGLLTLCEKMRINAALYKNPLITQRKTALTMLKGNYTNNQLSLAQAAYTMQDPQGNNTYNADQLPWPCIVGVVDIQSYNKKHGAQNNGYSFDTLKYTKRYGHDLLDHWIYMPNKTTVWTWGGEYNYRNNEYSFYYPDPSKQTNQAAVATANQAGDDWQKYAYDQFQDLKKFIPTVAISVQ